MIRQKPLGLLILKNSLNLQKSLGLLACLPLRCYLFGWLLLNPSSSLIKAFQPVALLLDFTLNILRSFVLRLNRIMAGLPSPICLWSIDQITKFRVQLICVRLDFGDLWGPRLSVLRKLACREKKYQRRHLSISNDLEPFHISARASILGQL